MTLRMATLVALCSILGPAAASQGNGFVPVNRVTISVPSGFEARAGGIHVDPATGAVVYPWVSYGRLLVWAETVFGVGPGEMIEYDDEVAGRPVRVFESYRQLGDVLVGARAMVARAAAPRMAVTLKRAVRSVWLAKDVGEVSVETPPGWTATRGARDLWLSRGEERFSISCPSNVVGPVAWLGPRETALMWATGPKGFGSLFDQRLVSLAETPIRIANRDGYALVFRHPHFGEDTVNLVALVFETGLLGTSVEACVRASAPLGRRERVVPEWHRMLMTVRFWRTRALDSDVLHVRAAAAAFQAVAGRLPDVA